MWSERVRSRVKPWVLDGFLTPYQEEGIQWAVERDGSTFWWACGSGKTVGALVWAADGPLNQKTVIVTRAPAKRQWQREASQYTNMQLYVLEGQGGDAIDRNVSAVVLSWEILPYWLQQLRAWVGRNPMSLIWDEVHKGKAWKRKEKCVVNGRLTYRWANNRAAACSKLSLLASRRLGLTATPIRDRRGDLWAQLDIVQPGAWGTNWDFIHKFCDARPGTYGGIDASGISNTEELKARLAEATHVVSYGEMSKHLPPKRRQLVYLPRKDQSRPAAFKQDMKRAAKRGKAALFEMHLVVASSSKRKWVAETVMDAAQAGQKVCVLTGRRKDCEALAKSVQGKLKGPKVPVWSGHGGDSLKERERMVAEYADEQGAAVFIGTTDAFGEAIDGLQNTDLVIFSMLPFTPGQVTQAEGRFSRHGSKRNVLIMYVVAEGTVDEHVADLLLEKLEAVETTLDDREAGGVAKTLAGEDDEEAILDSIFALLETE